LDRRDCQEQTTEPDAERREMDVSGLPKRVSAGVNHRRRARGGGKGESQLYLRTRQKRIVTGGTKKAKREEPALQNEMKVKYREE